MTNFKLKKTVTPVMLICLRYALVMLMIFFSSKHLQFSLS